MEINLNGKKLEIVEGYSLENLIIKLLQEKNLDLSGSVVLLNDEVIKKEDYLLILKENDNIEILTFVSGG